EQLRVDFVYSTDLFDAATIRRMLVHYERLLEGVVADPECRLSHLPLLSDAERNQLLVEWNDTANAFPRKCVHELFEEQVACTPEATAVEYEGRKLSYRELNTRANQLAHHLIALGVGPEVLVGVCLERSLELIVALLGILKAGGAYMPLEPSYPRERLSFMLEDARPAFLVTTSAKLDVLPLDLPEIVTLDAGAAAFGYENASAPKTSVSLDNLAYVIYTSGSTGRPRGVQLGHHGLCNMAVCHAREFQIHAGSRVLQFASFSFDASVLEIFTALTVGATLCLAPRDHLLPGRELVDTLQHQKITTVLLPPSALAVMPDTDLPHLETLIAGGERCTADLVRRWAPGRRFFNAYGPTECTVTATTWRCSEMDRSDPPIGRPRANARAYILDSALNLVPPGVEGELYIGGDGLARGYLNRPEPTAERFVRDPFSTVPGARMYRSGDLARYCPDGSIEFLGRLDDQVKIRGFRIEPGEVEAVLCEHPAVRQAVVQVREDASGDKRLVAYVVPADPSLTDIEPLRALLRERLPDYMRPVPYVLLEHLPLTANGKVDRKALPAPDARAYTTGVYEAPVGEIEATLAQIWAEVLRLERVGRNDNFFNLGGHSLLATKVVSRARDRFDLHLPLRLMFEEPTVKGLADCIAMLEWLNQAGQKRSDTGEIDRIRI
ncbi:MAG: amino acid adenylation domain-containing protein, partial [Betaproteobacteria bacterium]|nr:amino acid adenylation domain-containing protein [Betaproteobacteria bacterium]